MDRRVFVVCCAVGLLTGCARRVAETSIADQGLLEGARNAVRVCMNVGATDRVLVMTDDDTIPVGDALAYEASAVSADSQLLRLEDYGNRPFAQLPPALAHAVTSFAPSVTFFAVAPRPGEGPMSRQFIDLVTAEIGARHAHMPGITARVMREALRVDYTAVNDLTAAVHGRLRGAVSVHVTSRKGTDLQAQFSDAARWVPLGGLYRHPGEWGNLPDGEVFTCPDSVEGVLVADVVGGYFSAKYGLLPDPVSVEIKDGFARKVRCSNSELETELLSYLASSENGQRVGEFAVGTNIGVKALSGNLLQDEKIPGVHVAFGDPIGNLTGATWKSETHVDMVPSECTIRVDGRLLMERGRFTGLT